MYDPIDIHGVRSMFVYSHNNKELLERIEELKKENKELQTKLDAFTGKNKNSVIDGHICYRWVEDMDIKDVEFDNEKLGFVASFSCKILYKDKDTNEIIATKYIDADMEEKK